MGYNYYNYQVHLEKDKNYTLEDIKLALRQFTIAESTKSSLTLLFDGWKLWIDLASGADVETEAEELADWMDKPEILNCNSRLELHAEDDPDGEHFNDHLFVLEALSQLEGTYIYDPVEGEFLYEEMEDAAHDHQPVDMEFLESLDDDKVKSYIQKLKINSRKWDVWHDLGFCYYHLDRTDLAVQCYKNSILLYPENASAHYNVGQYYMDLKQYDAAKVYFLKAIELRPEKSEYLTDLGVLYAEENNKEKALEYLALAVEKDPENDFSNSNYGYFLLVYGEAGRAIQYIEKAILFGDTDVAFFNKAHVLLVTGSEVLAVRFYAMSLHNYSSENEFWQDYDADFSIMPQYGISSEYYQSLKAKIQAENMNPILN